MYPADLMLVKQKLSWQRSGPDCKCQFKNWHNSKVFKKITVFLPFFDFDQIDVRIGVFCLQNILSFSSEIDNHNPSWSWCLQTWRIVTNVVCLLDCGLVERSNSVKPSEERARFIIISHRQPGLDRWVVSLSPKYNCLRESWIHVGGDRDRTLSS